MKKLFLLLPLLLLVPGKVFAKELGQVTPGYWPEKEETNLQPQTVIDVLTKAKNQKRYKKTVLTDPDTNYIFTHIQFSAPIALEDKINAIIITEQPRGKDQTKINIQNIVAIQWETDTKNTENLSGKIKGKLKASKPAKKIVEIINEMEEEK